MSKFRILIADDHSMVRDGIKNLIKQNKDYTVAGEATTGQEAVEMFKELRPDLFILDISMPGKNGIEVAKETMAFDPSSKILMLSMYDDEDYISSCMETGVKGYVVKNESSTELNTAIGTILNGSNYFSRQVQQVIFKKFSSGVNRKKAQEQEIKLTFREIEIVKLIAEGLTSNQMADKLFISPRTVETHRSNLMKKTGVKNAIELVKKIEKLKII